MWWLLIIACRAPVAAAPPGTHEVVVVERGGVYGQPLATVVALHGLGDSPQAFVHALDGLPGPVRIVSVGGQEPWGDGGHAWWTRRVADGDWPELAGDVSAAADRLAPLLQALNSDPKVCGAPVVTGFSQGGMLSFALAGRHPEQLAGAVPVAGTVIDGVATQPYAVTHALHGDADTRVPYAMTAEAVEALAAAGQPVTLRSFAGVQHTITSAQRLVWYEAISSLMPSCPSE